MATLAKLVVKLVTDVSEFEAGMTAANKKLSKIGDQMSQVGQKLSVGVTLPLVAAGVAAVKFASDLNESMNKVDVVFGNSSAAVKKWAETSATSLGMSKNAALQAAGTFGNLFTSMGMTKDKASEMSLNLVNLAADLASFNNIDPAEALQKLQSGIVGESEPLRALGVNINETAMKAKALEMGLGGVGGVLTDQEKIMARYALIMEQTKNSQGDFARTSDGLANSTRILKAELEDVAASFGQELMPIAIDLMKQLIPMLKFFNELPTPVKRGIIVILGLAAALGPVLWVIGQIISTGGAIAGLFGTGGALAGAGAWITATLLPALASIPAALGTVGTALAGISLIGVASVGLLIAAIGVLIYTIINLGPAAWKTILTIGDIFRLLPKVVAKSMEGVGPAILASLRSALQSVINWGTGFYRAGQAMMSGFVQGIISYAIYVYQTVTGTISRVIEAVKRMLGIHSPSTVFAAYGRNMMLGMEAGIEEFSAKPVQATISASNAVIPAANAVRPGGQSMVLQIPQININGDLSEGQMKSLEERVRGIFVTSFVEALGAA